MPIANTVEALVVVNFEDRLTGPAQKAFEQFRKHAKSVFRDVCASGVAAFEKIKAAQRDALKFNNGPETRPKAPDVSLWEKALGTLASVASIIGLLGVDWKLAIERIVKGAKLLKPALKAVAAGFLRLALPAVAAGFAALTPLLIPAAIVLAKIALGASLLLLAWKGLQALGEITVNGKPIKDYLRDAFDFVVSGELTALIKLKFNEFLAAVGELAREWYGRFITTLQGLPSRIGEIKDKMVRAGRDLLDGFSSGLSSNYNSVKSRFLDFVGGLGARARSLFLSGPAPGNPPRPDPDPDSEELSSFASGIRFVPRDMLARIHKGETVLPRSQAERFRQGRLGGISVGNITLNMNGGSGVNRQEARRFARMIREELQRIDERMTS